MRYKLYTYRNLEEYNLLYSQLEGQGQEIHAFVFQETSDLLEEMGEVTIDITNLIEYLIDRKSDIMPAIYNFKNLTENDRIIIKESLVEVALGILCYKFESSIKLFPNDNEKMPMLEQRIRKKIYMYENIYELDQIIEYCNKNDIRIVSISDINNQLISDIKEKNIKIVIDLTSVILALENSKYLIYTIEQLLGVMSEYIPIINQENANVVLDTFPYLFHEKGSVDQVFPEISLCIDNNDNKSDEVNKVKYISDCDINDFSNYLSRKLVGHNEFKRRFIQGLNNFILLNKIKQKKILSLFLLGPSGVGKTEVARIVKDYLDKDSLLVKINFGNYSSQDALNNIIGSPRGYIGCENGELGSKINKSKAGIILCDEFEKTNIQVFNFFLQLLEDAMFTDTMGNDYKLDGYIIIFTSNLNETDFYKVIPPELQSRLDMVCEFEKLSIKDKNLFVSMETNRLFSELNIANLSINKVPNVDEREIDNIRDIKKIVQNNVATFINDNKVI